MGSYNVSPLALARRPADEHRCHVVVTIGRHGMVCAERNGSTWYLPAEATDVRDVCGAGDTVLAAIGVSLARGESLRDSSKLAVMTAAEQVSQIGIAPTGCTLHIQISASAYPLHPPSQQTNPQSP